VPERLAAGVAIAKARRAGAPAAVPAAEFAEARQHGYVDLGRE
jgi:hypothetical protein